MSSDISPAPAFAFQKWRDLTRMLVLRNLKIRYKGSALGFFWSLITPLAMILIYAIFAGVLGMKKALLGINGTTFDYLPFLVTGIVVWQFTAGCLSDSLFTIVGNANLVKKVAFPRSILPVSTVMANGINFLLTFIILVAYLAFDGSLCIGAIYWIFPALAIQLVLCLGLALTVSTMNVFYRDTEHAVGLVLLAWFFLSPVMYEVGLQTNLLARMSWVSHPGIAFLNPMTGVLALYRKSLMGMDFAPQGVSPTWILLSAGVAVVIYGFGLFILRKGDRCFGDVL